MWRHTSLSVGKQCNHSQSNPPPPLSLCSAGALALRDDGVLHRYPRAVLLPQEALAVPPQEGLSHRLDRLAWHALGEGAGALAEAVALLDVARPETRAQVLPGVQHRTVRVHPQPLQELPPRLLAHLDAPAVGRLSQVQLLEVSGHGQARQLRRRAGVQLRGQVDGHEAGIEVTA